MEENCNEKMRRSDCAVSMALDSVGDRWSLLILRDLMFTDKRSYGELQSSAEKIATNILATRLVALEKNQIIYKTPDPTDSRRSLYYLTEKGIDLLPVVTELMHWMSKHNPDASACTANTTAYKKDRVSLYKEMTKQLKKAHLQHGDLVK
ncbi:MAG: helix-turn-helix domain-containing protein [Ginsengibacter sp.]